MSDSHCGAGCTLGDVIAEFTIAGLGLTVLGSPLYTAFAGDLLLAWLLGIAFQYFAIKPMRNLSPSQGLIAAVKADTLSILTFEIGLYAWMALTYFVFFPSPHLKPTEAAVADDAGRYGNWFFHFLSNEPIADDLGHQGKLWDNEKEPRLWRRVGLRHYWGARPSTMNMRALSCVLPDRPDRRIGRRVVPLPCLLHAVESDDHDPAL